MIGLGSEQRLVVEESFYRFEVASLGCYVQARRAIVRGFVWHLFPSQFSNDVAMPIKRRIIHTVVTLLVFDLPVCQFVFDQDLCNHFVSETASEHQWSDPICCYREIHINVMVDSSEV